MADQLEVLKRLQALDAQLFTFHRQEQEKPQALEQVSAEAAAQERRWQAAEERLKALQVSQKEQEIELQSREANVKRLQGQLVQVKTNKEYAALQREIDSLKADNSLLEEAILRGFDAIEQAAEERQREGQRVAEQQERLRAERARIEQELAAIRDQVAQLERQRQVLVPEVPSATLAAYEQVLRNREGLALVPVVNESCGGCHRRLPPQIISEVHLKANLVTCEHCNRILYLDDAHSTV